MKSLSRIILIGIFIFLILRFFVTPMYYFPDGVGCWVYMSSIFDDNDLVLKNNIERFTTTMPLAKTETGYVANVWPIGYGIILTPFYLLAKLYSTLIENQNISLLLTNFGSTLLGFFSCFLLFKSQRFIGISTKNVLISSICTFFGTPLFFYCYFFPQSVHPVSTFIISLFLTHWLISRKRDIIYWMLLGLFAGIMTSIRIENIFFCIVIFVDLIKDLTKEKVQIVKKLLIFTTFALLGFIPQLLIWQFLYGSIFSMPQMFNLSIDNFAMFDVFFSPFHGIVIWTPLVIVPFVALFFIQKERRDLFIIMPVLVFLQIFIISFLTAWWGGLSFGIRYLSHSILPIGISMGLILDVISSKSGIIKYIKVVFPICAIWTFILAIEGAHGTLDIYNPLNWDMFFKSVSKFPGSFIGSLSKTLSRDITYHYPWLFFLIILITCWFLVIRFYEGIRTGKIKFIIIAIMLYLTLWNFKLISAHSNKKEIEGEFVTVPDLAKTFLGFDLKHRCEYYYLTKQKNKLEYTIKRLKSIRCDTQIAQDIIDNIIRSVNE